MTQVFNRFGFWTRRKITRVIGYWCPIIAAAGSIILAVKVQSRNGFGKRANKNIKKE